MSRVLERLDEIYAIAQHRAGYSPEEDAAHELAAGWMREAGLEVSRDEAGNLFGRARRRTRLGGLASRQRPDRAAGSTARSASLPRSRRRPAARPRRSPSSRSAPRRPARWAASGSTSFPDAYLEVHIEQGPVLARARTSRSASSPRSPARRAARSSSRAAPTTQARRRWTCASDALVAGGRVHPARARLRRRGDAVATVGAIEVEPNAVNVVPARVTVAVDARAPTGDELDALVAAIGFEPHRLRNPAAPMGDAFAAVLPDAPRLVSGAGHDAMFVPNVVDAVRALAERRRLAPSRRALERRRHRARRRCAHGGAR